MTIGLLGSSLIQVYWFNWSMEQQEARFDTNVIEALNQVEERLTAKGAARNPQHPQPGPFIDDPAGDR